jgi:hypothetical protein
MPTSTIEQMMIGHMNGPPARTISHMCRTIPEAAPPDEGVSRLTRDRVDLDAIPAEDQRHRADAARIEHRGRGASPAVEHMGPAARAIDAARGDGQSRRQCFYPLRRGTGHAGLTADGDDLTGERCRADSREQGTLGSRVHLSRQQHRASRSGYAQQAVSARHTRGESPEFDAVPMPAGIAAALRRQSAAGPAASHENSADAALEG